MGRFGGIGIVSLALALVACSEDKPRRARPDAAAAAAAPAPSQPAVPSFRRDILPVFAANCAGAHGCHGEEPTDEVELDLRPDAAYADLVDRPAKARRGAVRVAPGDPAASFLIAKLEGALATTEGKAMPLDPRTKQASSMTPPAAEFVATVLRPWIAAGAPDN